jgi:hypothetical protein
LIACSSRGDTAREQIMIKCPKCDASLPDGAGMCQFCQAVWAPQAGNRPAGRPVAGMQFNRPETWTSKAYYAVAAWWVISGVWSVLQATLFATKENPGSAVGLVFGAITALVGIGLLLRVELVRNIVVFLAALNILLGLFGIAMTFLTPFVGGIWGAVVIVHEFIDIALNGLMIFLIGETDSHAPNF